MKKRFIKEKIFIYANHFTKERREIKKTKTASPGITFEIKMKTLQKCYNDGHVGGAVQCSVSVEWLSDTAPTRFPGFQNQVPSRGGGVLSGRRADVQQVCSAWLAGGRSSFLVLSPLLPRPPYWFTRNSDLSAPPTPAPGVISDQGWKKIFWKIFLKNIFTRGWILQTY